MKLLETVPGIGKSIIVVLYGGLEVRATQPGGKGTPTSLTVGKT